MKPLSQTDLTRRPTVADITNGSGFSQTGFSQVDGQMNDDALTSEGFGMTSQDGLSNHVADQFGSTTRQSFGTDVSGFRFDGFKQRGLEVASTLSAHTKANPWFVAGLAGVGALAAGYLLGRLFPASESAATIRGLAQAGDQVESYDRDQIGRTAGVPSTGDDYAELRETKKKKALGFSPAPFFIYGTRKFKTIGIEFDSDQNKT
jgi:hypothetical protein